MNDTELLQTMKNVYFYDPTLVETDIKDRLIKAGLLTKEQIAARETNPEADLDVFYRGK